MNSPVYLLEDLRRWFKEKWTAQDGSECGSYTGKGRVKCRPSKRVSGKTAKTWGEMDKKEKRKAVRLKQKAHRKGHQFSSHKTGKTWKGDKYRPSKKKKIEEAKQVPDKNEMKQMMKYLKGSIDNPLRFYYLMLMSGMNGAKANSILFDLKNPLLRTSNTLYRKRLLGLLKNIIDAITKDQLLFNRVRSMALSGNLSLHEEGEGGAPAGGGGSALSVGSGQIEGMPDATPAAETSAPIWGTEIPQKKKERKRRVTMIRRLNNLYRSNRDAN